MVDNPAAPRTVVNASDGLGALLSRLDASVAFTSYQSGNLFLVGRADDGKIVIDQQRHERAMGVHWDGRRLHLATATQVLRFENMLKAGELSDGRNDAVLVPRVSWTTNDVDAHEIATDANGRPLFVATRFNCVATVDTFYSFAPIWTPPFLSGSGRGDRCHLNGMALVEGRLACVSLVGASDVQDGWRSQRLDGGMIVECRTGQRLVEGLSMPHSPRIRGGELWFVEAGRGLLAVVDLASGVRRDVAFLPGFARGLSLLETHALVTLSKPRDKRFEGLPLECALAEAGEKARCGVVIVNLENGAIDGWISLEGGVQELFDVTALPAIRCPRSLAPGTRELWDNVWARPRTVKPQTSTSS